MSTEAITLEVDSEAAQAFNSASVEEREKLQVIFSIWLKKYANFSTDSLRETMDDISRQARNRGLTPDILASILKEE